MCLRVGYVAPAPLSGFFARSWSSRILIRASVGSLIRIESRIHLYNLSYLSIQSPPLPWPMVPSCHLLPSNRENSAWAMWREVKKYEIKLNLRQSVVVVARFSSIFFSYKRINKRMWVVLKERGESWIPWRRDGCEEVEGETDARRYENRYEFYVIRARLVRVFFPKIVPRLILGAGLMYVGVR